MSRGYAATILAITLAGCDCGDHRTGVVVVPDGEAWLFITAGVISNSECAEWCEQFGDVKDVTECSVTGWRDDADSGDTGGIDRPGLELSCTGFWSAACPG